MTKDEEIDIYNNPHCDLPFIALNLIEARIKKLKLTDSYFNFWWPIVITCGPPGRWGLGVW